MGTSATNRKRILENIARLRRAELGTPSDDVAAVRIDLESQLGGTVSRSLSASLLGVSHTALNNWVEAGDVPVVLSERGRKEIPIPVLLDLWARVEKERESGRRKLHVLEPVMAEGRRRAARIRPLASTVGEGSEQPHRAADRRGLAYHRVVASRLRRPAIEEAERKLRRWEREGKIDPHHAQLWGEVLALPVAEVRAAITAEDERGRDLRQNSPLAGLLSEPERRKIMEAV